MTQGTLKKSRRITESPFPKKTTDCLRNFFGHLEIDRSTGRPVEQWKHFFMEQMPCVYPMRLAMVPEITLNRITVHREVVTSLQAIFHEILEQFGSYAAVAAAGADLLGEAYNFRPEEGGAAISMHAYGAAITLDPTRNPYGKVWKNEGMMHEIVIDAFKFHGWKWGGDRKNNPHCAYFEALS